MKQEEADHLKSLRGCIASVCTTGLVENQFAQCLSNARSLHDRQGFHAIEYKPIDARLVEAGRDEAVKHMLHEKYAWLIQVDADATFEPDAFIRLLYTAYIQLPQSDMVGAYSQLKGHPFLPTIDTGTGRWEEHYPGEGVIPVIRTGGHFMLCKRSALEKVGLKGPWFRTRLVPPAVQSFAEVDGVARQHFSGRNPLTEHEAWNDLIQKTRPQLEAGTAQPKGLDDSGVGEDSAWCDLLKSRGGQIFVDTNIVTGHLTRELIGPGKLKKAMTDRDKRLMLAVGVWS